MTKHKCNEIARSVVLSMLSHIKCSDLFWHLLAFIKRTSPSTETILEHSLHSQIAISRHEEEEFKSLLEKEVRIQQNQVGCG